MMKDSNKPLMNPIFGVHSPKLTNITLENGCLRDDPASFWGKFGLFSGANLLLVSGRVFRIL